MAKEKLMEMKEMMLSKDAEEASSSGMEGRKEVDERRTSDGMLILAFTLSPLGEGKKRRVACFSPKEVVD